MANSKIQVSQGLGTNVATVEITESAEQKHLTRVVPQDENGQPVNWATNDKLDDVITSLSNIKIDTGDIDLNTDGLETLLSSVDTNTGSINSNLVSVKATDGLIAPSSALVVGGVTAGGLFQTFETNASGHLNVADGGGSITIDATSLPLPTGAATSALQTTANSSLSSIDTKLNNLDIRDLNFATDTIDVSGSVVTLTNEYVDGNATPGSPIGNLPVFDNAGITNVVSQSNPFPVNIKNASLPLPTGASTSALQSSLITSLGTPFQAGGSIGNTDFGVNNGAGALAVNIQDGGNSITVDGNVGITGSVAVTGTFFQATQPISATSLPLPTGAATETTLSSALTALQLIDNTVGSNNGLAATQSNLVAGIFNTTLPIVTTGQQVATPVDNRGRYLSPVKNGRFSYSTASGVNAAGFLAAATANTDIYRISGSATKTIYVKKIRISATATAIQGNKIAIIKRSALNVGGTFISDVAVPYDSTTTVATSSFGHYTTAPTTLGTSVGEVRATKFLIPTITTLYNPEIIFEFTENGGNPFVLNGVNESLGILINTAPGAGNNFLICIEFDEE